MPSSCLPAIHIFHPILVDQSSILPHFLKILSPGGGEGRERLTYIGDPIARLDLIWEPYVLHHRLRFMTEIILFILRFFSPPQQKRTLPTRHANRKNMLLPPRGKGACLILWF